MKTSPHIDQFLLVLTLSKVTLFSVLSTASGCCFQFAVILMIVISERFSLLLGTTPNQSEFSFFSFPHHSVPFSASVLCQQVLLALSAKYIPNSCLLKFQCCLPQLFHLSSSTPLNYFSASTLAQDHFFLHTAAMVTVKGKSDLITAPFLKSPETPSRHYIILHLPNFRTQCKSHSTSFCAGTCKLITNVMLSKLVLSTVQNAIIFYLWAQDSSHTEILCLFILPFPQSTSLNILCVIVTLNPITKFVFIITLIINLCILNYLFPI